MKQRKIIIAIDGQSGTGKSTLAKGLADKLGYLYIDSGAMYRAITLYFLQNHIDKDDEMQVRQALKRISIRFEKDAGGTYHIYLNGENVESLIRGIEVAEHVSGVSAISEVREFAVKQQREFGIDEGVVMDGRDIGTTVFPHAEVKFFMVADTGERVKRRYGEMIEKNPEITIEEVRKNLTERDYADSHRKISPLRKASDAVILDNTHLTKEQQLDFAFKLVEPLL